VVHDDSYVDSMYRRLRQTRFVRGLTRNGWRWATYPLLFVDEDGFDGGIEETIEFEGEGEAGVVFTSLDSVNGLTRNLELLGKLGLGPVAFGAEDAESVIHWASDTDGR
jgi:hypothetical protein